VVPERVKPDGHEYVTVGVASHLSVDELYDVELGQEGLAIHTFPDRVIPEGQE